MNNCNIACYPELAYEGHVRVSIAKGKRIIKSYEYKNAGGPRLFNFLANCTAGNFFDNDRPTRIVLFKSRTANDGTVYDPISTSSGLFYSSAPLVIKNIVAGQTFYQTTLHFTIPYYEIYDSPVNGARLYSANALSATEFDADDYSAAVIFNGGLKLDPAGIQQNYMLIIDWELQFKNMSGADTAATEMNNNGGSAGGDADGEGEGTEGEGEGEGEGTEGEGTEDEGTEDEGGDVEEEIETLPDAGEDTPVTPIPSAN